LVRVLAQPILDIISNSDGPIEKKSKIKEIKKALIGVHAGPVNSTVGRFRRILIVKL
jgi:hypothetical protein